MRAHEHHQKQTGMEFRVSTTVGDVHIQPSIAEYTRTSLDEIANVCAQRAASMRELGLHMSVVLLPIILDYAYPPLSVPSMSGLVTTLTKLAAEDEFDIQWYDAGTRDFVWACRRLGAIRLHEANITKAQRTLLMASHVCR